MNHNLKTRIRLWSVTVLTGLVGIVNVLSAVTPNLYGRNHWLKEFLPFEIRASGHIFAALTGFVLLTLATNLLRRKRVAWLLTISLLIISIVSHLLKGWDYEESILSGILLVQLILMRDVFTAKSDRPSIARGVRVLIGALLFTLAYGTVGFYLLDGKFTENFNWKDAILQTLAMFFTEDNWGLQPTTKFGDFFADSIYIIAASTITYAMVMLLQPVFLQNSATSIERQKAKEIVEQYGCSSLAAFTLLSDKSYFFSPSGKSVIAYVPKGRGAIALGDPIGPIEDRKEVIVSFQQFCQRNDWYPAFYQTLPDDIDLYISLGFRVMKIGEEAIVDLKNFTLQGKAGKNFRPSINRLTKLGYQVSFYQPPISNNLLHQLKPVSDEWLRMAQGSEKRFSLGWFDEAYLRNCEIAVVHTPDDGIAAFTNVLPEYQLNEITIDMMRHRSSIENGMMDFLFTSLLQHYKEQGYDTFNFGLSALAGVGDHAESRRLEKVLHYLYEHLNRFYNFQGLHAYKDKFHPNWEPRYLVYPSFTALPDVVVALIRADSGDRLLDYFKPGA
ncbi:bifunctional lysylphosphatidylglycerol flippase/synthetase MprF [Nostoc sp. FACHB-152]|uniref:phosphatidylglycerol lysyltransferase domain-containing protein n=1 Tax=unclassified Nostoc TaxID=2593658 RepID=UPI001684B7CE|nr:MULTISPECIES: phosphatidylglycerol lysyltransferase domain-containing protein [unclassified Nostoc]MBD2450879.1 bifunctional lysylphosphatidylglycerol flippase/synthetase MprF [Nostoc sp. FACHB-152]MBD2470085.1 bifunctional lysylphosphatidylglycerol flippase/synthetase MprF [Nostoc sp. FACHB-145]